MEQAFEERFAELWRASMALSGPLSHDAEAAERLSTRILVSAYHAWPDITDPLLWVRVATVRAASVGRHTPLLRRLASLPPSQRHLLLLRRFADLSDEQLAAGLGMPVAAVRAALRAGSEVMPRRPRPVPPRRPIAAPVPTGPPSERRPSPPTLGAAPVSDTSPADGPQTDAPPTDTPPTDTPQGGSSPDDSSPAAGVIPFVRRPRPAHSRPKGRRASTRPVLVSVASAAVTAVAVTIGIVIGTAGGATHAAPRATGPVRLDPPGNLVDPAVFAVAGVDSLTIRSTATGAVVKQLTAPPALVDGPHRDGGFVLDPTAANVFTEVVPAHDVSVERVDIATGVTTRIVTGSDPAVSPDGTYLAYAAGRGGARIGVLDLLTGAVRYLYVDGLLGPTASFENTATLITWLSNRRFVALPERDAQAVAFDVADPTTTVAPVAPTTLPVTGASGVATTSSTSIPTANAHGPTCSQGFSVRALGHCAVVVDLGTQLSGSLVFLGDESEPIDAVGGDGNGSTLIVAEGAGEGEESIGWYRVSPAGAHLASTVPLAGAPEVEAFAPGGDRMLYLHGSLHDQIWVADISPHSVSGERRLVSGLASYGVAW